MKTAKRRAFAFATFAIAGLAACENTSSPSLPEDQVMAPGVDLRAAAKQDSSEAVEAGHRLIAAGEYELALRAFNRAALSRGALDAEILSGLGTANLGLGRLGQAEELLRRAVRDDAAQPVDYNNLGVLLMEQGKTNEALQYFRRAFALSNGENIAIRDNLRLVLAKTENSATLEPEKSSEYKLVRRGNSDFIIRPTP
ncbi:tetratricopeptide repeat protein [Roseobacter litoralis]|uniref:Uncharacterized protein n=1 Tax=Roseobacter litoralis (strain ATCC 49566 / DSM 6996 / JCM 21268 / NBRC 15278 / OCh 149) TaxID=391595 RepID=F7ZD48_ROSLO|nr:tetratricopeptide repeat protein [Roseobacter litoralis]AEI93257.1 hypothetical protein RLO149_c012550 [Roseobacter litoralis Och 149]